MAKDLRARRHFTNFAVVPSISSSSSFTKSRILDSVSTVSRICSMMSFWKLLALSLGVSLDKGIFLGGNWWRRPERWARPACGRAKLGGGDWSAAV